MNLMKKLFTVFAALTVVLVMAGCDNLAKPADGVVTGDGVKESMMDVSFTLSDEDGVPLARHSSSRTIMEAAFGLADLKFYIEGKSNNGKTLAFQELTVNTTDGSFTVLVDADMWEFTVYACKSGETLASSNKLSQSVLIGYGTADVSHYSNVGKPPIVMRSLSVLTRTAAVKISVNTTDGGINWFDKSIMTAEAGIYSLKDGSEINAATFHKVFSNKSSPIADSPWDYSVTGVSPGTYVFKVKFTTTFGGENSAKTFIWSDTLVVDAGHDIDQSVTIANGFGKKPDAPSDFVAYYTDPDAVNGEKTEGVYGLAFQWTDNSKNEEFFLIEVADITGVASATLASTDANWTGYSLAADKVWKFTEDGWRHERRATGSTYANNTKFVVKAQLGRKYAARICAASPAGNSDWVYVTAAAAAPTGAALPDLVTETGLFEGTATTPLNLYRLTYELRGGTYTDSDGNVVGGKYIRYHTTGSTAYVTSTETSSGSGVFELKDPSFATPKVLGTNLKNGDAKFTNWRTNPNDSSTNITSSAYSGTTNCTLYAAYEPTAQGTVSVEDKSAYNILDSWITCTATNGLTLTLNEATAGEIAKTDGAATPAPTKLQFTFNPVAATAPIEAGFKFDEVKLTVEDEYGSIYEDAKQDCAVGTGVTFADLDISTCRRGNLVLKFSARYNLIIVNKTYVIYVTD